MNTHDTICDEVFRRHPEVADCEAHRALLTEVADDGTNYDVDSWERVLGQLVASGQILPQRTEEMERQAEARRQAAELEASKAERARRMAYNDDKRALRKMPREEWELEMKRRRAAEAKANAEAVADENKKLQDLSVDELRKLVRADSVAKGKRPAPVRDGADGESIW